MFHIDHYTYCIAQNYCLNNSPQGIYILELMNLNFKFLQNIQYSYYYFLSTICSFYHILNIILIHFQNNLTYISNLMGFLDQNLIRNKNYSNQKLCNYNHVYILNILLYLHYHNTQGYSHIKEDYFLMHLSKFSNFMNH